MTESREELPYAIQRKYVSIFPKGPNCQGESRLTEMHSLRQFLLKKNNWDPQTYQANDIRNSCVIRRNSIIQRGASWIRKMEN